MLASETEKAYLRLVEGKTYSSRSSGLRRLQIIKKSEVKGSIDRQNVLGGCFVGRTVTSLFFSPDSCRLLETVC